MALIGESGRVRHVAFRVSPGEFRQLERAMEAAPAARNMSAFVRDLVFGSLRVRSPAADKGQGPFIWTPEDRAEASRLAAQLHGAGTLVNQLMREVNRRRAVGEEPPIAWADLTKLLNDLRAAGALASDFIGRCEERLTPKRRRSDP